MIQDNYWGNGGDLGIENKGKNHLGMNLMRVRHEIRQEEDTRQKMEQLALQQ
jgi:predicted NAD-dependent protein-ADP-ribosyltransferase YbiA (DUF1768 family)